MASDGYYYVRLENDLRFHCYWTNGDAQPNQFKLLFTNFDILYDPNALMPLDQTKTDNKTLQSYPGFVIPLIRSFFYDSMMQPIRITVLNDNFQSIYDTQIKVRSSIVGVDAYDISENRTIILGTTYTFKLSYESLGEPSCSYIKFKVASYQSDLGGVIGTDSVTCSLYYPAKPFIGTYSKSTVTIGGKTIKIWSFSALMNQVGYINLNVEVRSFFQTSQFNYFASVSSQSTAQSCNLPIVDIAARATQFYSPKVYKLNQLLAISSQSWLNCSAINLKNSRKWRVYRLNETTGTQISELTISGNPTVEYSDLVMQPYALAKGLYRFTYQVTLTDQMLSRVYISNEAETYVQIVSSGVVLNAINGGIAQIRLGLNQSLDLDPLSFSYDLDDSQKILFGNYKSTSAFGIKFYCQLVDDGIESYGYPQYSLNDYIDLFGMQLNRQSLINNPISSNHYCFDLNTLDRAIIFGNSNRKLTLLAGSLAFVEKRAYEFKIELTYQGVIYDQTIRVIIDDSNNLPIVNLRCKFDRDCLQLTDSKRINPNSQLILAGSCSSGCSSVYQVAYQYQIYKYWKIDSNDTQEKWAPVLVDLNNANNHYFYGDSTSELTIYSTLFLSDSSVHKWRVDLTLTTISYANGISTGSSSLILESNQLPHSGTCTVNPTSGISFSTQFTLSCINWIDDDGSIAKYSFYGLLSLLF